MNFLFKIIFTLVIPLYSLLSAPLLNPDNDGDLIPNSIDLDDDNDGILDTDEGICLGGGKNKIVFILDTSASVSATEYQAWTNSINDLSTEILNTDSQADIAIVQFGSLDINTTSASATISRNFSNVHPNWTTAQRDVLLGDEDHLAASLVHMKPFWLSGGALDLTNSSSNTIIIFTDASKSYEGSVLHDAAPYNDADALDGYGEYDFLKTTYNAKLIMIHADIVIIGGYEVATAVSSLDANGSSLAQLGDFNLTVTQINNITNTLTISDTDTDKDNVPNCLDLDSDNDGISDFIEAYHDISILDSDNNGRVDNIIDLDNDGLADVVEIAYGNNIGKSPIDTDADSIPNIIDLDSDNDGIPDIIEAKPTVGYVSNDGDITNDVNQSTGILLSGLVIPNVEANDLIDTLADYIDIDSDEDALLDVAESGLTLSGIDANSDGIDDAINASYQDPDGDINNPLNHLENTDSNNSDVDYRSIDIPQICDGRSYGLNYNQANNYSAIYEITSVGTTAGSMTTSLLKDNAFPFSSISLTKGLDNKLYTVHNQVLAVGNTTPIYVYDPSTPSVQAVDTGISLPYPNKQLWWISGGLDPQGNIYFMLKDGSYLVKINLNTSVVTTVWSTLPATATQAPGGENFGEGSINLPVGTIPYYDITFDSNASALITDANGHYVWKVTDLNSTPTVDYLGSLNGMSSISDPQWINDGGIIRLFGSDANTPDGTHYIDTTTWNTTKVGTTSFFDMASCDFNTLTPSPIVPSIKLAEYRFDSCEFNGLTVEDSSGNNFFGIIQGDITTSSEAMVVRAAQFNGGVFDVNISAGLDFSDGAKTSVSFWMYWDGTDNSAGGETWGQIPISWGDASNSYNLHIDLVTDNVPGSGLRMGFNTYNADNYGVDIAAYANGWHHIVAVFENGDAEKSELYIDTVKQVLTQAPTRVPINARAYVKNELRIGGMKNADQPYSFKDYMDEVKIYSGALSTAKIASIYTNELAGKRWDGTILAGLTCTNTLTPFSCNDTLYLSNNTVLGTGSVDTTKTWLHSIDQNATPHSYQAIGNGYANKYNALGYNIQNNFMYALDGNKLIKIDSNASVQNLGSLVGLPPVSFYSGEFDRSGNYYLSGEIGSSSNMYKIDINTATITETITFKDLTGAATSIRFWDMAIDATGNYFYVMLVDASNNNDTVAKIEISTGIVTPIGTGKSSFPYVSLVFSDIEGKLFMMSNQNGFYSVNTLTGEMYSISSTQNLTFNNDGTSCSDSNMTMPLIIAIDMDVSQPEGDSGITNFVFNVSLSKPAPLGSGFSYRITDGLATIADNDYFPQVRNIVLPAGAIEANITVEVVGDTKMEENEEFYVTLFDSINLGISNAVGVGTIINDDVVSFNIERTNSNTVDNSTQDRKEALYTQISGRDFNYAVVTYDKNISNDLEEPIDDVTVKVQLLDMNNSAMLLYESYLYFPIGNPISRLDNTLANDLEILSAHRDANYRILYIVDGNGSIIKGQYDNAVDYSNTKALYSERSNSSRDNFAIRAEKFNIHLYDGKMLRKSSTDGDATPIKLAAGYDYDLNITAVNYGNSIATLDYNTSVIRILAFNDSTDCNDESNATRNETFEDGDNGISLFEHHNVGLYALSLEDTEWAKVDFNKTVPDCLIDNSDSSADGDSISGCNIVANSDMNISFYPYQFEVNFNMSSLPNSGHPDFLYMDTLTPNNNNYAIQFEGNVTAQSEDDVITTNFTAGCASEDVLLTLNADSLSEDGVNQLLLTSPSLTRARTDVKFSRLIRFNNNLDNNLLDINNSLDSITSSTTLSSNSFLDENNGTIYLDMRYNINKNISETINPVQITFNDFNVSSTASNSIANDKINITSNTHTPRGIQNLNGLIRDFYFTQVTSDLNRYPKINFNPTGTNTIRTPLNVDIFCNTNITYCRQTNILEHTDTAGLTRVNKGWYLSFDHNISTDGNIISLTPNNPIVHVNPSLNINFTNGRNGVIVNEFTSCGSKNDIVTVQIIPETVLLYNPDTTKGGNPEYRVSCSNNANSALSGVGRTGNIINMNDINITNIKTNKMDW